MLKAPSPQDPVVLSYLALRKAVGIVALALPFAVAVPGAVLHHTIQSSISAYYYTGARNLFVGSLCALGMFMLCTRGYDIKDEIAGLFSALCAVGVAMFPTTPESGATSRQVHIGIAHYAFAAALFLTLSFFCLVLFKMSAVGVEVTRKKTQRNIVYTVCGVAILLSLLLLVTCTLILHREYLIGRVAPGIFFETTSLWAFGFAWLIKGETFLKDEDPRPSLTRTTDGHVMISNPQL
jgi:hypothetical protein